MSSLKSFKLWLSNTIDQNKITELLDNLQSIEEFHISANFSYFNLDNFFNLKSLCLSGTINDDFNFEILEKLCFQLEYLAIQFFQLEDDNKRCDETTVLKLLNNHTFPNLQTLNITNCNIRRITKKFFDRFPILRELDLIKCNLEMIDNDAFSNLKQLVKLNLRFNLLATLKKQYFSELVNLEYLILSDNRLELIEKNVFSNLRNLQELDLSFNKLSVLDRESFIGTQDSLKVSLHENNLDFGNLFGENR